MAMCLAFLQLENFTPFISLTLSGGYHYFQFTNESAEDWRGNTPA